MTSNLERFRADLDNLSFLGTEMLLDLLYQEPQEGNGIKEEEQEVASKVKGSFDKNYQRWYTEACAVVRQLLPDRLNEFVQLYHGDGKRKAIDVRTYNIQDWLNGVRVESFNDFASVAKRFQTQIRIFDAASSRLKTSLFDIAQLTRADVFDSELDAARGLVNAGFVRPAGVLTGVVLEKHLLQVCEAHQIKVRSQKSTISSLNDELKNAGVLDVPRWRQVQRLADLRNLCGHGKDREPTKDEVSELVDGVEKFTKTLF
jgi:hypothetical protein